MQGCGFLLLIYAVAYFNSFLGVVDGILVQLCALYFLRISLNMNRLSLYFLRFLVPEMD